eukprot:947894-Pelagomonas_calceolata.AAC.4
MQKSWQCNDCSSAQVGQELWEPAEYAAEMPDAGGALCAGAERRRGAHAPHPKLDLQGMTFSFSSPTACSCC